MRKGTIKNEDLEIVNNILNNQEIFDEWLNYIRDTEPEFYTYIQDKASKIISNISKGLKNLTMQDANGLAHALLAGFCCGYIIKYKKDERKVDRILNSDTAEVSENKFQMWIDGKLPEQFYKYALKGLNKTSTMYQAKANHTKLIAQVKEHMLREMGKRDFLKIEDSLENTSAAVEVSELVEEEDLENLNG